MWFAQFAVCGPSPVCRVSKSTTFNLFMRCVISLPCKSEEDRAYLFLAVFGLTSLAPFCPRLCGGQTRTPHPRTCPRAFDAAAANKRWLLLFRFALRPSALPRFVEPDMFKSLWRCDGIPFLPRGWGGSGRHFKLFWNVTFTPLIPSCCCFFWKLWWGTSGCDFKVTLHCDHLNVLSF